MHKGTYVWECFLFCVVRTEGGSGFEGNTAFFQNFNKLFLHNGNSQGIKTYLVVRKCLRAFLGVARGGKSGDITLRK